MLRKLTVGLASLLSLVFAPSLVAQQPSPGGFQQIVEVTVNPGHQGEFERWMKDLVAAANKVKAPQTWTTFQSDIGREGAIYRVALSFATWSQRGQWLSIRDTLVKANGEAAADKMMASTVNWSGGTSTQIWENQPDASSNPTSGTANFYQVTVREVKPGRETAYLELTRKYKAAYEASPSKLNIGRSVLRVGPSSGLTFRRAEAFDKWADLDGRSAAAILSKHFGEQESARMALEASEMLVRQETFISVRRPELSREGQPVTATR